MLLETLAAGVFFVSSFVLSDEDLLPPLQAIIKKEATTVTAIKIFFIC
jgi:hypothetical protein